MTKLLNTPEIDSNVRRRVLEAVNRNNTMADAAMELGISRRTLYRYLRKWGLTKKTDRR